MMHRPHLRREMGIFCVTYRGHTARVECVKDS